MNMNFAHRMDGVPRSFIREILKITNSRDVISFAGGLPNADLFPVNDILEATHEVLTQTGNEALQYSNSEGFLPLRNDIAVRYKKRYGLDIPVDQILITTGSQQALDLLGKVFINEGDEIVMEEPGYLGAIQALSVYQPRFLSVPLHAQGMDTVLLKERLEQHHPKIMYAVPNFQNPSGITYTESNRREVAAILDQTDVLLIEDDPYGELRFRGQPSRSFKTFIPDRTIMLGTFSKTVVPSFRIGWVVAPSAIMEKLIVAKQAADLHTNFFCQMILHQYFQKFDNEVHVQRVSQAYGKQRDAMILAIKKYFPAEVKFTQPDGGMFLWVTLPDGLSSMKLLNIAMERKVVFVPGNQFYTNRTDDVCTFRLNFTCSTEATIDRGIRILGETIREIIGSS